MRQTFLIHDYADVKVIHGAICEVCKLPQRYPDKDKRDLWATDHVQATGHAIKYLTEIQVVTA